MANGNAEQNGNGGGNGRNGNVNGNGNRTRLGNNPMTWILSTIVLFSAALTGGRTIQQDYDLNHVTEEELGLQIRSTELKIHANTVALRDVKVEATCRSLQILITLVEQAIWQMEEGGQPVSQRLVEKRRELSDLEAQYNALKCPQALR